MLATVTLAENGMAQGPVTVSAPGQQPYNNPGLEGAVLGGQGTAWLNSDGNDQNLNIGNKKEGFT